MENLHRFDSFSLENVDNSVCAALADVQQEYYTPKSEMWRTLKDGDELDKYPPKEMDATVEEDESGRLCVMVNGLKVGYVPDGRRDRADAYKVVFSGGKIKRVFETNDGNLDYEIEDGDFVARVICYNYSEPPKTTPVVTETAEKPANQQISIMVWLFVALCCLSFIGEIGGAFLGFPVPVFPALGACVLFGIFAWALSAKL